MKTILIEILFGALPILFLLGLCVLMRAAEFALLRIRLSHFDDDLLEALKARPALLKLSELDEQLSVDRIRFIGLMSLLAWFYLCWGAWQSLIDQLLLPLPFPGNALLMLAGLLLLILVHWVFAESVARPWGIAYPLTALRWAYPLLRMLGPFSFGLPQLANLLGAKMWHARAGSPPPGIASLGLRAQLEVSGNEDPEMSTVAQLILKNTLKMRDLVVADVLLPRNQVRYFDINEPLEDNLNLAKETGHTRFPLCIGDLDHCIGLVHIKDIFRFRGPLQQLDLRKIKRSMIRIDSEEPLESALTKLLAHRMHMALVIDEFHGAEGVLTLERILEQLVGDIRDEFDADEEVLLKVNEDPAELIVSGLTPLHDINAAFQVELDTEEVSTIGGLITSYLGRIPDAGERVQINGLEMEVIAVEETRILEIRLRRLANEVGDEPSRDQL